MTVKRFPRIRSRRRRPTTYTRAGRSRRHARRALPLLLALIFVTACAPGEPPPPAICDVFGRALFTIQLLGGATVILGLAVFGLRKNLAGILPSQNAQFGAVALSILLGLGLLAFSTDIGNQVLVGFGIESMYTLCGLG